MRKDIHPPKVEGVAMAVVREPDENGEEGWFVYLINQNEFALENVLVSSRGYGEIEGETRRTVNCGTIYRHSRPRAGPRSNASLKMYSP